MSTPYSFPPLVIGDLQIPFPIIQGGMGVGISMHSLASAVASQGGMGVIATAGVGHKEPDIASNYREANRRALRTEIRQARAQAGGGALGVNIMSALSNYDDLAKVAMEEGIDAIISGAGLPMNLPLCRPAGARTKLIPIVSSGRAVSVITRRWKERFDYLPDAIVVEGPMAGGHLGFKAEQLDDPAFKLEVLLAEVLDTVHALEQKYQGHIPVIAAGGIYTGADVRRFLGLGAAGVQMATRFVTTVECDASDAFKNAYIEARQEDLTIIKSPVGMPGRAIRNSFIDDVRKGEKKPFECPFHCIITCDVANSPYCIAHALVSALHGNFEGGFAFAGANAWRATRITTVKEVFDALREEANQAHV